MLDRTRVEAPEYVLVQGKVVKRVFHLPDHDELRQRRSDYAAGRAGERIKVISLTSPL
jgi:hypothetical protein